MATSTADAQRMQAQSVAPATSLAKSKDVVQSVKEAGQKYGIYNVAGLPLMQADQKFVEAARGEIIVVSTADIKFVNKEGKPIEIENVQEGFAIFKDGAYMMIYTNDDARKVPWNQKAYFYDQTLKVIKEAQEAREARPLPVYVGCYDLSDMPGLVVGTGIWPYGVARVALKSQVSGETSISVPQQLLRNNEKASALLGEIQTDMESLQKKIERLQELVRPTNE
jgi:hypothetical protein